MVGSCLLSVMDMARDGNSVWINVHSLLIDDENTLHEKWIYGENNFPLSADHMRYFATGSEEFNPIRAHLMVLKDGKLIPSQMANVENAVACQMNDYSPKPMNVRTELFRKAYATKTISWIEENTKYEGCFVEYMQQTSISCGLKCHLDLKCRSYYFEENKQYCIHTQFVDMSLGRTVSSLEATQWNRYTRPMWRMDIRG
ncbi:unnamed protein product [Echinostoma caproni]|uniref:Apple domain-containing protein n=1 Tax=Echinostoma caproni TaxID=27848 RepID=A0A183B0Z4_9TREM|nr:unnamed protein product [Echinostoma caproni]